jgi:hypothetical protein
MAFISGGLTGDYFFILHVSRFLRISSIAKRSHTVPMSLSSSPLYGKNDMSGRSPNEVASVAPQQEAPDIMVHIKPPIIQLIDFQLISARFQYLRLR